MQHDVSPPLRDLVKLAPKPESEPEEDAEELHLIPLRPGYKPAEQPDLVLQSAAATNSAPARLGPTMIQNFDGIGQGVANFTVHFVPPDTNGAVGLTQYVQWVNASFAVFDKATGNILLGPVNGNTLWTGFGGGCETDNDGDPIVMYDRLADRWVFTQFVIRANGFIGPPFLQCVAVSKTSDATGQFFRYSFQYSALDDYPKMGLWPDAYYITFNMFNGNTFLGTDACAYERDKMLTGDPATQICFQQAPSVGGVLPSDMDGHTPPPPGSPNYMVEFDVNSLNLYKFHVDFATPANSTFSAATNIPVSPFTPLCGGGRGCVPQQGTFNRLDSLADRLMYRLAYRNFGDHESLVVNHSVAATVNGSATSGVRWYEIQNPGGASPIVAQQGTFAPDANYRWMGSMAMDQIGDLALGYSVSSSTMFPSIAFTVRTPSDAPGTMQDETSIISGLGSETGFTRWGDYSAMQVDPVDDCTFWYTTEYFKSTSSGFWNTRIASFKFPDCDKPDLTVTSTHTGNFTQDQVGASYTLSVRNAGGKDTDGSTVTVTDTLPVGVTVTAASGTGWTCTPGSTTTCTRNDVLASRMSYPDIVVTVTVAHDAAGIITNAVTVAGGGEQNTGNDSASDPTTVIQLGPDPTVTKSHVGNFIRTQTGTYTITVKNVGLSSLDGSTVTVTDTLPAGLTAKTASGTGWSCTTGSPTICTRTEALASNASYPPIALAVDVANGAPSSVINTVTVSGGGNVNTLNDTATDPTTTVPPPPDLSITKTHNGNFNQGQFFAAYTVILSNAGGASSTSGTVTVTDTLPNGLSFGSASGPFWNCSINGLTATCTRSDALAGGNSYPALTLQVNVANNAPASVINTATVSGGGDVTPGNNAANDPTTINPSPDLTIVKTHTPDPFTVGQTGTYTITVSNVGNASTSGLVTVNDSLPTGLTATSFSAPGWACPTPPTTVVNCTRSDALAKGSDYPLITVTVSVTGGGPAVTNFASVSGGGEFNGMNDFASDFTKIIAPSLTITKSHTGNFTVGQTGTYTITVSNVGPIATIATPVSVHDGLPSGLTATAFSGPGWSCSGTGFVTCTRSDVLAPNSSYPPITLTVAVGSTAPASVTNFVDVSGGGDTNSHFASDFTTINVPDLAITKTHSGNFVAGQTGAVYTINVSNVGTIATAGGTVVVQDFVPFAMVATAASGTGWTCSTTSNFVNCSRPADVLAPGAGYPPITVTVNVVSFSPPALTNAVNVSGIGDANLNNNNAADNTTIIQPIDIAPASPTSVNITAGTAATFSLMATLSTNPPVGNVMFSVSGVPPNAKATFSSASITQTGPVTLSVDTSGNGHVASLQPFGFQPSGRGKWTVIYAAVLFPLFALYLLKKKQKATKPWVWAAMGISGLALILAFSGCGGGSPPPPPPVFTPPGTYFVRMTATSSNGSLQPVTMQFTVVVR